MCREYRYERLYQRDVRRNTLRDQGNQEDTMDRKVAENLVKFQEAQQREARHISHLHDEGNVFIQEITAQY